MAFEAIFGNTAIKTQVTPLIWTVHSGAQMNAFIEDIQFRLKYLVCGGREADFIEPRYSALISVATDNLLVQILLFFVSQYQPMS